MSRFFGTVSGVSAPHFIDPHANLIARYIWMPESRKEGFAGIPGGISLLDILNRVLESEEHGRSRVFGGGDTSIPRLGKDYVADKWKKVPPPDLNGKAGKGWNAVAMDALLLKAVIKNKAALAAWIGRRKHGRREMNRRAVAARKRAAESRRAHEVRRIDQWLEQPRGAKG